MPGIGGVSLPESAAELAEALGQGVKNDGVRIAIFPEAGAGDGVDRAVAAPIEDPIRLENGDAVVALQLLEQTEHLVDRAAGGLAPLVDSDHQETAVKEIAPGSDRHLVRGPAIEELVDRAEELFASSLIERGRDAEDPDACVVGKLRNVEVCHQFFTL